MDEDFSHYIEEEGEEETAEDQYPGWGPFSRQPEADEEIERIEKRKSTAMNIGDENRKSQPMEQFVRRFQMFFPKTKKEPKTNQANKLRSFSFQDSKIGKQYENYSMGDDGRPNYPQFEIISSEANALTQDEIDARTKRRNAANAAKKLNGDNVDTSNTIKDDNWKFNSNGGNIETNWEFNPKRDGICSQPVSAGGHSHFDNTNTMFNQNSEDEEDSLLTPNPAIAEDEIVDISMEQTDSSPESGISDTYQSDVSPSNFVEENDHLNYDQNRDEMVDYSEQRSDISPPNYSRGGSIINSDLAEDLPPAYEENVPARSEVSEQLRSTTSGLNDSNFRLGNEEHSQHQTTLNQDGSTSNYDEEETDHYWRLDQVNSAVGAGSDVLDGSDLTPAGDYTHRTAREPVSNEVINAPVSPISYVDDAPKRVFRSPAADEDYSFKTLQSPGFGEASSKGVLSSAWKRLSSYFSMKKEKSWSVENKFTTLPS